MIDKQAGQVRRWVGVEVGVGGAWMHSAHGNLNQNNAFGYYRLCKYYDNGTAVGHALIKFKVLVTAEPSNFHCEMT